MDLREYLKKEIAKHVADSENWQKLGIMMESDEMVLHCFEESEKHKMAANALIGVLNFLTR